jgi:hypothetical protein
MTLVMTHDGDGDGDGNGNGNETGYGGGGGGLVARNDGRKYECDNCRAEFPNKTTADRHMLFCRTLAEIRRGGGASAGGVSFATHSVAATNDDALMPTPREMFILIQELAAKYNKVKDELDVMKQWAKMVGRRVGGSSGAGGGAGAGLDFTSISRQKRQNMEVILNEEDEEHPDLAELRPGFSEWLAASDHLSAALTDAELNVVFNEDLVAGITAAILRVLAGYTAESRRSHLCPFKLADIKQGAFYIYDTVFGQAADTPAHSGPDLPTRRWRAMEPCEFQLFVRTFHKLLFKEFKKWQDLNWEAQRELTKQRQKAASTYKQMIQCSPAMASCDGMYPMPSDAAAVDVADVDAADTADVEDPTTPVGGTVLSEDFATLYNKYADKMMGGALSDDTILSRVRAKLWKDMKAWRL